MSVSKDYIAHGCEKLAQAFYTVTTWPGVEPALVRRSTNEPPSRHDAWPVQYLPSHRAPLFFDRYQLILLGDRGTYV